MVTFWSIHCWRAKTSLEVNQSLLLKKQSSWLENKNLLEGGTWNTKFTPLEQIIEICHTYQPKTKKVFLANIWTLVFTPWPGGAKILKALVSRVSHKFYHFLTELANPGRAGSEEPRIEQLTSAKTANFLSWKEGGSTKYFCKGVRESAIFVGSSLQVRN